MAKLTSRKNLRTLGILAGASTAAAGLLAVSCGEEGANFYEGDTYYSAGGAPPNVYEGDTNNYYNLGGSDGGSMGGASTGGGSPGGAGNEDGYTSHLPACDSVTTVSELDIDLFGEDGHLFYFEVTPKTRVAGDDQVCRGNNGGVYGLKNPPCPLAAENIRIVAGGAQKQCADTGRVELELVGQSSFRPWLDIPNFKIDVEEFQDQKFKSGDKNLRLNNGQADSTIIREAVALRVFRGLGYPAPPTRFVQTQSNVWDTLVEPGVFAAHNMVRPYKKAFFKAELAEAVHVWEGAGDPFMDGWYDVECEWTDEDECDDARLADIVSEVQQTPSGLGFMAATEHLIDWPALHKNQCIAALTGTGDDWIHNNNNVVLVLREDGRVMYLPYSTDISGDHPWYKNTPYDGMAFLAQQCAWDPDCREQALDTCDDVIDQFEALDVANSIVAERCNTLEGLGLMRGPDSKVCDQLKSFYGSKAGELRAEIEGLRDDSGMGGAGGGGGIGGAKPL
jgi:hypothetical protein